MSAKATKNLAKSNWQLGASNTFDGLSMNRNDYKNNAAHYDPTAKAKRLELVQELRRSNLPTQDFSMPKSTQQDCFVSGKTKEEDAQAARERKQDAAAIFARVRGVKPNFSLGEHKLDYTSENKGRIQQPTAYVFDSKVLAEQASTQRKHNFKMSFEQGSQFETDKGTKAPF